MLRVVQIDNAAIITEWIHAVLKHQPQVISFDQDTQTEINSESLLITT